MIDRDRPTLATAESISSVSDAPLSARPEARVKSISAMTLAPDGRLVVADWRSGALHVLDLVPAPAAGPEQPFNVRDLDRSLSAIGGGPLRATALVYEMSSGRAVVAIDVAGRPLLAVVRRDGSVTPFDPDTLLAHSLALDGLPGEGRLWGQAPVRSLTVTSLAWQGAELLVAGVANTDFSSTLRRIAYPFDGSAAMTRVEMYHAVHNQIETRAPIRAMAVITLEGVDHLLAAYTCTPLVVVPMSELVDGRSVRAKTVAELGFGNTPLSVTPFAITHQGQSSDWVLVANASKSADLLPLRAIAAAAKGDGLSTPVKPPFEQLAGVPAIPVPLGNLVALLDQGPQFLLSLRRDAATGGLELVSIRKGAFFRLSDFINEYDLPGYAYPQDDVFQQSYIRPFHAVMKLDEGHADLVR